MSTTTFRFAFDALNRRRESRDPCTRSLNFQNQIEDESAENIFQTGTSGGESTISVITRQLPYWQGLQTERKIP